MSSERRVEYTDLDRREPRSREYRGAIKIPAYRRYLLRELEHAASEGDLQRAEAIRAKLKAGGMRL